MVGIGDYLRQARERQGYTLEQMNSLTNIHTEYLNALENDRFDQLPSPFYAKAFLRTYAKCLGLDVRPLLDYFERTVQKKPSASEPMATQQPSIQPTMQPGTQPRANFMPNLISPTDMRNEPTPSPMNQRLRQSPSITRKMPALEQPTAHPTNPAQQSLPPAMHNTPQTPIKPKTMQPQGIQPQGMQPQGMQPQSMQPQGMQPQNLQPQAMLPSSPQSMGPQSPLSLPPQSQQPASSLDMSHTQRVSLPDLQQTMQHSLSPRRVAMESKLAREHADRMESINKLKKWALPVAIGALLLIGGTAYFTMSPTSAPADGGKTDKQVNYPADTGVRADGENVVFLEEGGTSENQLEGQLFYVHNADKLEVELKGKEGESTVRFAPTAKDNPQQFTLKVGEERTLEIGNQTQVWFRLGTPSNVEVTVNGQKINTAAQDTEKSYRVELKK